MEYKTERQKSSVKLSFTVPADEWEAEINAAYVKTKGKYNIPGFRRGHAPRKYIESLYGPTVFIDEAFNACASKSYTTALKENEDIFPVDEPKVDIDEFGKDALKFTIEVTVKPEVTLGQYKGLSVVKAEYPVTDEEVDHEIMHSRQAKSRLVDVTDRAAADGDTVIIDYSGSVDGVKFNGGTAEKQQLVLGSHSFIPGFEEQVVGMNIGDEKDLKVKFPEDYHAEELKGKDAVFAVKLHEIKFREIPELTDEFVKDTTQFETVAEYRESVFKRLTEESARREKNENQNKVLEAVVANATVEIPECMVENELNYMLEEMEYRLGQMYGGMKLDDYFKYTGSSRDDFKKERKAEAEKNVKTRLVLEAVIKAENTQPTQEAIDARIAEIAASVNKSVEEYKQTMPANLTSRIKSDLTVEKVLDDLVAATVFTSAIDAKPESAAKKPATKTTAAKKPAAKKTEKPEADKKD